MNESAIFFLLLSCPKIVKIRESPTNNISAPPKDQKSNLNHNGGEILFIVSSIEVNLIQK